MAGAKAEMPGKELTELPINRAIRLSNETCVYCGDVLSQQTSTKEHVIGRRFVPKGKLDGQWNLIVRACRRCNQTKSDLEDDLSAISMLPDVSNRYGHSDEHAIRDAQRKAQNAFSRRTNKPVKDSNEQATIRFSLGPGAELTFNMTAPPQADPERIFQLAKMQLMGFFYWITFNHDNRRGGYWPEGFHPILEARRSDWGNIVHRAFMDAVVDWEPRVLADGAQGFFKVVIRKHPTADCWSWALEWNQSLRTIGFFGQRAPAEQVFEAFPKFDLRPTRHGPNEYSWSRIEVPLKEEDDRLFAIKIVTDDGNDGGSECPRQ